jgi:hypothetical protein
VRGKLVRDEFTDLPISRQRKYQLRMQRDKRCHICGEPLVGSGFLCLKHLVEAREWARKRFRRKRRSYNSGSYKLQAKAAASAARKRIKKAR